MTHLKPDNTVSTDKKKNIIRRVIQVIFSIVLMSLLLFITAGSIEWIFGWIYIAASVLVIMINLFIFPAELVAERGKKKGNVEKWYKVFTRIMLIPFVAFYIVAGLDFRFGWTPPLTLSFHIAGLVAFFAGNALVSWAMVSNQYFSTAVRIQYERAHSVSSVGPYGYVRHPGYAGMIIYNLATPLLLGTLWAFTMAGLTAVFFIIRTELEDSTLKNKLEGYREYAENVRYRLVPGAW